MSQWYIRDGNELDGPYTLNELQTFARDGDLNSRDMVQQGEHGEPMAAKDVPELRTAASGRRGTGRAPRPASTGGGSNNATVWIVIIAVIAGLALLSCVIVIPALMLPAVQQVREAARKEQSRDHLHNIVIAMHDYQATHSVFPPEGIADVDGNEGHGLQTFLLPFVEQYPLYDQMQVDTTRWRDPAIDHLIRVEVEPYLSPSIPDRRTVEGFGATHYVGNRHIFFENSAMHMRDILDGTSNTIAMGEIASAFPAWADVKNSRDPADGLGTSPHQFGRPDGTGANMAFLDGRVSFVSENIDPNVLKGLATHAGGEAVSVP
jgi:prepilin-type processing-associated H-X9-DG protein